ncbi:MAG: hypothetical protein HY961_18970 [Ignavibacteriae bacterium]|nr:hypothetical protein [Ignavibacteriota bacterium]
MTIRVSAIKCFVFLTLFLVPLLLEAQQDSASIRQRILESEESDQILIQRTRDFILNKLEDGRTNEAGEAFDYAVRKLEGASTKAFWITEKFLLGYWFGQYELLYSADSIETSADLERSEHSFSSREVLYPQQDKLSQVLEKLAHKHRSELVQRLDARVDDKEKHDYLVLFFDWLTLYSSEPEMTREKAQEYLEKNLTPRAEEFLANYKDSRFRPFVQRHFRYVYVLNDWGYGYFLGMGLLSPQSIAERYLKPEFTLGMGVDVSWKRALLDLGFDIGIPVAIREPFVYKGKSWNTNVRHNYYTYYLNAGYVIGETDFLKFTPRVGIGVLYMSVCDNDKEKAGGDLSMTQGAMQYGVACDLKLSVNDSFSGENTHSYSGVRLGLDYFQFLGSNPIMSGGMLRFQISWSAFGRSILRDM